MNTLSSPICKHIRHVLLCGILASTASLVAAQTIGSPQATKPNNESRKDPLEEQGLAVMKSILERIPPKGFNQAEVSNLCNRELPANIYGSEHPIFITTCIKYVSEHVGRVQNFNANVNKLVSSVGLGKTNKDQLKGNCTQEATAIGGSFSSRYRDGLIDQCMKATETALVSQNGAYEKQLQDAKANMLQLFENARQAKNDAQPNIDQICTQSAAPMTQDAFRLEFLESCKSYIKAQIERGALLTDYDVPLVNTCHTSVAIMLRNETTGQLMPLATDNSTMATLKPYETIWKRLKMNSKTRFRVFVSTTDMENNPGDDNVAAILKTPENCVESRVIEHDPVVSYLIDMGDNTSSMGASVFNLFIAGISNFKSKAYSRTIGFPLTPRGLQRCQDTFIGLMPASNKKCENGGNRYYPACYDGYKGVGGLCIAK